MNKEIDKQESGFRRQVLDFGPLLLFFSCNYFYGIYWGTATLVVSTLLSLSISWILDKRIPILAAFGCAAVVFFGALTLIFDKGTDIDDTMKIGVFLFIKIKPTVVSVIIAFGLIIAELFGRRPLQSIMSSGINLSNQGWQYLTRIWILMFFVMAIANEIAWRNLSTNDWVSFKAFGIPVLSIIFAILSVPIIRKFSLEETENNN